MNRELALAEAGAGGDGIAELAAAAGQLDGAVARAIDFNARNGSAEAQHIKAVRRHAAWASSLLTALCLALAVGAGLAVRRQVRRHAALVEAHAALQDLRATELESFAGRVAHDLLNPVAASQLALQLAGRRPLPDDRARELVDRSLRNLARTRSIVDGLLEFARAGAAPAPDATADLAAVVEDAVTGALPAAESERVSVAVAQLPRCAVACSPGVLASLTSNLVQNGIKHMGGGAVRRIAVRAALGDGSVRVEVEDTGPGIPPDALASIFLPWVRGATSGRDGLGLGLATVRRLAEAHGGRAGVRSALGEGATFWFELPARGPAEPASGAAPARRQA